MPRRRSSLRAALRLVPGLLSLGILAWAVATNPFTRPVVAASTAEVKASLDRALARRVTEGWLDEQIDAALAATDTRRLETLMAVASERGLALDPDRQERIEALLEETSGVWGAAAACGTCIADAAACPTLALLASCTLPFELSPAGDARALGRAGLAYWHGDDIDWLDTTLALTGLGATALILTSGGTSLTVKAGAGVLRTARRLGTLTPAFTRVLVQAADVGLRPARLPAYAVGRLPLDEVVDTARLARLAELSADLGRVATNTSLTDAALLLRHVDTAGDAARLARVSDAAGPATRPVMEILGKRRAFRALTRLSRASVSAAAFVYAALLHLLTSFAAWTGTRVLRAITSRL